MSSRGPSLLSAAWGLRAVPRAAGAAAGAAAPAATAGATPNSTLAISTGAAAAATAAIAIATTATAAASGKALAALLCRTAAHRRFRRNGATARFAAGASGPTRELRADPWIGRCLEHLLGSRSNVRSSSGAATVAATTLAAARTGCSARGRSASNLPSRFWQPSTMYGNSRSAAGSAGVAAAQPVALHGASVRPLGLLVTGGQRLAAVAAPLGLTAAAAAAVIMASGGAASVQRVPLAAASAVRSVWRDSRGYEHFEGRGHGWSAHSHRLKYGAAALVAAAISYYFYCIETVPYTGRRHAIILVSPLREQWIGKMGFEQIKALARAEHKLLPDSHPDVQRVVRLGSAIAAVAGDGAGGGSVGHMRGLKWEFAVIADDTLNAAVLPGGKVVVFSGLLRLLGDNDDALAAVLAHEVGHVLARHPAEQLGTLNAWILLQTALRLMFGFGLPDKAVYLGLLLPNSRKNEHEADAIGLRLMARACFDPAGATTMLDKLNRADEMKKGRALASLPPFLSTHPLTAERIKQLEGDLEEAYKLFEQSGCAALRSDLRRGLGSWLGGDFGRGADDWDDGFRST